MTHGRRMVEEITNAIVSSRRCDIKGTKTAAKVHLAVSEGVCTIVTYKLAQANHMIVLSA